MTTCSHVWKDRRFIHQLVYNWPVSPHIEPGTPLDGQPRKHMQYGQTYECQNCHIPLSLPTEGTCTPPSFGAHSGPQLA